MDVEKDGDKFFDLFHSGQKLGEPLHVPKFLLRAVSILYALNLGLDILKAVEREVFLLLRREGRSEAVQGPREPIFFVGGHRGKPEPDLMALKSNSNLS